MNTATIPTQQYSFGDLYNLALQAGLSPPNAIVSAAVAMAESSGNPSAVSSTNDVGLWQINLTAHPQYAMQNLKDPVTNAKAMAAISNNGSNWNPWTTYQSGAYRKYLPNAQQDSQYISGSKIGGAAYPPNPGVASYSNSMAQAQLDAFKMPTIADLSPPKALADVASDLGVSPGSVGKDFLNILFMGNSPATVALRLLEIWGGVILMGAGVVLLVKAMSETTPIGQTAKRGIVGSVFGAIEGGPAGAVAGGVSGIKARETSRARTGGTTAGKTVAAAKLAKKTPPPRTPQHAKPIGKHSKKGP